MILILSTFSDKEEARKIGNELLKKKLIACYNLFPAESAYWWTGKIEEANEFLMIMKTLREFKKIEKFIAEHHSYDTPEIIAIEPKSVNDKYLKWINEVC